MKKLIYLSILLSLSQSIVSQNNYSIEIQGPTFPLESGHFKMGNPGPANKEIEVNNQYLMLGKKPLLPVMGEIHYTRIRPEQWEETILKMKACGINIISTYLFWNQHEEIEGQFNWSGEKDLRAFVQLCQKHDLFVYPRIGPWSHGEVRNGGTPDWILRKKFIKDRSNDPVYQNYVARYFKEIAKQLNGLYYKDGGNIIGIQLENEYWHAKEGEPHIKWLKDMARECGIDVPLYTVTGWGGGSVPPFEVIPLWGGYADEPWIEKITKNPLPLNFQFDAYRDNKHIGNDQIERKDKYMTYERYPFFTCEMGVGIPMMYHRRVVLSPIDGLGMVMSKLGSGSNLIGYYMFAGGTNPRGELHSTEEEQEETGYWSRTPVKSYDFRAAIRESGEIDPSYNQIKKLHYFIHSVATDLAPMLSTLGKTKADDLQFAVRSLNGSGYLFGINYCRFVPMQVRKNVQFSIKFKNETLKFPQKNIEIPDSTLFIWPLNLKMDKSLLKYATAQLLTIIDNTYVFFQNKNIPVEFAFDASTVANIQTAQGKVVKKDGLILVSDIRPGKNCFLEVSSIDGNKQRIWILTEKDATDSWIFERSGKKEFYISNAGMYIKSNEVYAYSTDEKVKIFELAQNGFIEHDYTVTKGEELKATPHPILQDALWLESANFKEIPDYQARYHRIFQKEFSLDNPSSIRRATLFIYPESDCRIHVNDKWINQEIKANMVNAIDITGYVGKGENNMYLSFPFIEGKAKFSARAIVEYENYDRVEFSSDLSWLTMDMYTYPAPTRRHEIPVKPTVVNTPDFATKLTYPGFGEWEINVPRDLFKNHNTSYLHISYVGDRAELYNGYRLSADDFNNNISWQIGLKRLIPSASGQNLRLVIYPLPENSKIYFDVKPEADSFNKVGIISIKTNNEQLIKIK